MQLDLVAESPAVYGVEDTTEQVIKRLEMDMKAAAKELELYQLQSYERRSEH